MRRTRTLTNGIKKYVWDVFERPFYTWDKYNRPYYVWDIFNRTVTAWTRTVISDDDMGEVSFDIPFTGGYYYTYESASFMFNSTTGKFDLITSGTHLITADTTLEQLNNAYISDAAGEFVDRIFMCYTTTLTKNLTTSKFEFRPRYFDTGYYALGTAWGKGTTTGTTAESFVNTTYPTNGYDVATELYYVIRTGTVLTPTGLTVTGFGANDYPLDGYDSVSGYYYKRISYTKTPTGNIVKSQYPNTYPALGYDILTGFWYEKRAMS